MLLHLTIRHYATIELLDLDLNAGMNVITGETGAGKSIILDALGLALGDRADTAAVRPGHRKAEILAHFDVSQRADAQQWLGARDLAQEQHCLLRRVILPEGRSRAYINGIPCPLSDLKALGGLLIDIHSQHEHQSLLQTETHRRLLDDYSNAHTLAKQVYELAHSWQETRRRNAHYQQQQEAQQARQQLLAYQLDELEQIAPLEGELSQLEYEHRQHAQAGQTLEQCQHVWALCSDAENGGMRRMLANGLHRLNQISHRPAALNEVIALLTNAQIQIDEAASELERFIEHAQIDPERQQYLEQRLNTLYQLARKHRISADQLPSLHRQLTDEQNNTLHEHAENARLVEQLSALAQQYTEQAQQLSQVRQAHAQALAQAIEQEIHRLGMPHGHLEVRLSPTNILEPHPHGFEHVSFWVSTNPGQPLRPLAKVASGGELSRISLAIQVISARSTQIPTLVFDEVDVGIGGPTADAVGQLLRQLGTHGQVLSVTHLPQVAAYGHWHLHVHKRNDGHVTCTAISQLTEEQRITEIARMLGGAAQTEESVAHAKALRAFAQRLSSGTALTDV